MLDWLLTNVYREGDCRSWAGCTSVRGTPRINWLGRTHNAQRLVMTMTRPRVGSRVWALCGNKACMEPDHLTTGSAGAHIQWMHDQGMLLRGRQRGLRIAMSSRARFGVRAVPMLQGLRAEGLTYKQIGDRIGLHPASVGNLLRRWT